MTEQARDRLRSILFEEDRELVNIKFMPGNSRSLTPRKLSDVAARAIDGAFKGDMTSHPPRTNKAKCKLDAYA